MKTIIFVQLLDEGTDVWRPVEAEHIRENIYRIVGQPPNADETWAFKCNETVRCQKQNFASGKTELVAFEVFAEES